MDAGRISYRNEPVFRAAIAECAAAIRRDLSLDLRDVLYPENDGRAAADQLAAPEVGQAALFALEYALSRLWMHWGVMPAVVVGEGPGELVAAVVAGVFQLQDAIGLTVRRARMMAAAGAGADTLAVAVRQAERRAPRVAMAAAATGDWVSAEQAVDSEYWTKTLLKPQSAADLRGLLARSPLVLLTVGPQDADSASSLNAARQGAAVTTLPTLRKRRADVESMFETLAQLWLHGVDVDWRSVQDGARRVRVPLPTYPFERERYWIDPVVARPQPTAGDGVRRAGGRGRGGARFAGRR